MLKWLIVFELLERCGTLKYFVSGIRNRELFDIFDHTFLIDPIIVLVIVRFTFINVKNVAHCKINMHAFNILGLIVKIKHVLCRLYYATRFP